MAAKINGIDNLDKFTNRLDRLSQVVSSAAPKIEERINALIAAQLNAGTTPDGTAWKPNKDGSKPLRGIEKYVHVTVSESSLKISLEAPATYHNSGTDKLPKRQIIPEGKMPESWVQVIKQSYQDAWDELK